MKNQFQWSKFIEKKNINKIHSNSHSMFTITTREQNVDEKKKQSVEKRGKISYKLFYLWLFICFKSKNEKRKKAFVLSEKNSHFSLLSLLFFYIFRTYSMHATQCCMDWEKLNAKQQHPNLTYRKRTKRTAYTHPNTVNTFLCELLNMDVFHFSYETNF